MGRANRKRTKKECGEGEQLLRHWTLARSFSSSSSGSGAVETYSVEMGMGWDGMNVKSVCVNMRKRRGERGGEGKLD